MMEGVDHGCGQGMVSDYHQQPPALVADLTVRAGTRMQEGNTLVVCYLHNVASQLELRDASTGQLRQSIPMPGLGSVAGFSGRREDTRLFFKFTGFTEPGAIYQ